MNKACFEFNIENKIRLVVYETGELFLTVLATDDERPGTLKGVRTQLDNREVRRLDDALTFALRVRYN